MMQVNNLKGELIMRMELARSKHGRLLLIYNSSDLDDGVAYLTNTSRQMRTITSLMRLHTITSTSLTSTLQ
jgi:hypothetical protein